MWKNRLSGPDAVVSILLHTYFIGGEISFTRRGEISFTRRG